MQPSAKHCTLLQASCDRAHRPRAAVPAQTDCRGARAAKAIRKEAKKAGSAAAQQVSAPATVDSAVESTEEFFSRARRPRILGLKLKDKRGSAEAAPYQGDYFSGVSFAAKSWQDFNVSLPKST